MNRREALTAVSVLLGGTIVGSQRFLSGCASPASTTPGLLSADDRQLLDEIGETIIPTTPDSPGARAAKVGEFMNVFVTDCYDPDQQLVIQTGLPKLRAALSAQYAKPYSELTPAEQHEFLMSLEGEAASYATTKSPDDPALHYYPLIKQMTVVGYFTSEIGATQALRYVAVPGTYEPCIDYNGEPAWAI